MVRPVKEYRVKINGGSLQVWKKGEYAGSISLSELYHIVAGDEGDGTR